MRGERKKFAITARRSVRKKDARLNNTVMVEEHLDRYTCCISFSDDLIQFVGSKLPRGVANFDPAYLAVTEDKFKGVWVVSARYFRDDVSVDLWVAKERPSWLKPTQNT